MRRNMMAPVSLMAVGRPRKNSSSPAAFSLYVPALSPQRKGKGEEQMPSEPQHQFDPSSTLPENINICNHKNKIR